MTVIEGFILGIVQGLTEFLPVSSSGHLVLFEKIFNIKTGGMTFEIAVHLATLISVCIVLREELLGMLKKPFGKLTLLVAAGTVPTLAIAAVFNDFIQSVFKSGATLGIEFILTGLVLWYAESAGNRKMNKGLEQTTYGDAAIVGAAQGVAILPAISRSGLTMAGALARGLNREFALKFSFLMSVPAILAGAAKDAYDILKTGGAAADALSLPLLTGMLAAAVSGYIAVRFMLKVFARTSLKAFSYYVFALGGLILLDQLFFGLVFTRFF